MSAKVTPLLCERICDLQFSDLDDKAVAAAKRLLLDGIAVAVAGSDDEPITILAKHYRALRCEEQATAIGNGFKLGVVSAAALNGAAMHVLDFEPMWSPSNHALSTTLPAILALAEQEQTSGADLVTALVKGCEIQGWVREASRQYEPRKITFHPPGTVGPMGSAVAAAHLLKLDAAQLAHAMGIAASRAAGVSANIGTMTKCTHCGQAAASGLEAAMLARMGFGANAAIFDAPLGYVDAFFREEFHREDLLKFGEPLRLLDPGFAIKMYPSQYATHFAISAALDIGAKLGTANDIKSVAVVGPIMPYIDRPLPATGLEGKFSIQYTTALALLDGHVGIESFTDQSLSRADMQTLLRKITYRMSPDIPAQFEKMHVRITVGLGNDRNIEARCDGPRGVWGAQPITDDEHLHKIRDCLSSKMNKPDIEELIGLVMNVDRLQSSEIRRLIALAGCFSAEESKV
jgi:2-methylcitrate dehydratase PrpD